MFTLTLAEQAADFIAHWEQYRSHAYWDVNHWRVGYGSDTEGPEAHSVTRETMTTQERALQNLQLRVAQFVAECIREVGSATWHRLNQNQQVALVDICYNYGHVPLTVMLGEPHATAQRFLLRGKDNNGINARRRRAEAELYVR